MEFKVKTVEQNNKQNKSDIHDNKTQITQINDRCDKIENNDNLLDLINSKCKHIENKFDDFLHEYQSKEVIVPSIPQPNVTYN